jgi:acyl-CoA synthetase (AMP-forming)/AMP-acid ligase II
MFARIVNSSPDPARLKTVRVWLSASDHLPADIRERLRQFGGLVRLPFGRRIPPVLLNGYGMVELGGLAMMGVDVSFMPGSGDFCFPVPPFQVRIVDDNGKEVKSGRVGELQIRRGGMRPHYWKDKGDSGGLLTADGFIRTGDLATRNGLGLIRLVGRSKDVIKSGGYSIYVRELEEAVLAHPQVARAAAFGLPHKEKGEIAVAAVELLDGASVSETELVDWCRQSLAAYKAPRRIWILDAGSMPKNHNGKTLRRELRERFAEEINRG